MFTGHMERIKQQTDALLLRLDPGWAYLLVGIVILGAGVLIPAQHDRDIARWERDRALAIESQRLDRLERYSRFLQSLRAGDESVVLWLASNQLNLAPPEYTPVFPVRHYDRSDASILPALEPDATRLPAPPKQTSLLGRWSTDDRARLWLLAGGVLAVLAGLMPPARGAR